MKRSRLMLFASHLAGNALLLLLGYYWLGLGESDAAHLAWSGAVILLFVLGALWLHGTALVAFRGDGLGASVKRALRNLAPLFVLAVVVLLIYAALQHFYYSFGHEAFTVGSYSTMKLRRPVEPGKVLTAFHVFITLMRWLFVPAFALPLAAEVANNGWAGFRAGAFRKLRKFLYWLKVFVILVSIRSTLELFSWIPKMPNFSMEVVSVIARFGLGYFIFTLFLLVLELTASGNPRVTQPSTVPSP